MKLRISSCALFLLAGVAVSSGALGMAHVAADGQPQQLASLDWQLPNEKWMLPIEHQQPIRFVTAKQNPQEWMSLKNFWNEGIEKVKHPRTGEEITRKVIKIRVPLGLSEPPAVPAENEMTVRRWALGKKLYFDPILSSDGSVSCASCHDPRLGWTDQKPVSTGIFGNKGGVSAPTVLNAAYQAFQFWDGRAASLEDQAQGPVGNALEMFDNKGHAWNKAVSRVRAKPEYVEEFRLAYGTDPTRDTIAKAIATFERTVLSGNSIHDRADFAMRMRVAEEGGTEFKLTAKDYETALKQAFEQKDVHALEALKLDPNNDAAKVGQVAESLMRGNSLFFNKARCSLCHVGDNFTDNQFHNLGVGVKDGKIPNDSLGRFGAQPIGHKNPEMVGAFKTPTLRGLVSTAPYMHDGSEKTLEEVVEFYDKGGNANRYLDTKMRDFEAEKSYLIGLRSGQPNAPARVELFGPDQVPIVPLKLNLTKEEKADLVLFLRALEGDPVDPIVSDPARSLELAPVPRD